jgi:hypothetical protein
VPNAPDDGFQPPEPDPDRIPLSERAYDVFDRTPPGIVNVADGGVPEPPPPGPPPPAPDSDD